MADGDLIRFPVVDTPHPLGRHVWHDPRNRQHRALSSPVRLEDRSKHWYSPDVFNQRGSSCTAQSAIGVCRTGPNRTPFAPHWPGFDTEEERHALYLSGQYVDPFAGQEPQMQGSSTDSSFKVLRERGFITGWRFLFGFDETKQYLMHRGPFSAGTIWYDSMFDVDAAGYLIVNQNSGVAGGHAYRIVGNSETRRAYRMVNSWSTAWGQSGRAWIRHEDMRHLLEAQGEAVTIA